MIAKVAVIAAAGIAAANAQACTNPSQFSNNPVTSPNTGTFPTIGQAFPVVWDPTGMSGPVTLTLLSGCPSNCQVVTNIATSVANTGVFSWTPACSLTADEAAEGYGIQMIDETLCKFQYSFHFGLHPDTAGVCSAPSSPTSVATSTGTSTTGTTTTTGASSATTTTTRTGASSATTTVPAGSSSSLTRSRLSASSGSSSSAYYPTGGNGTSGANPTLSNGGSGGNGGASGPGATATVRPQSNDAPVQAVSFLGGAAAIFGAVLLL